MDIQIKLVKNYYNVDEKKGTKSFYAYDDFFLDLNDKNPLFNIEETDNVGIKFICYDRDVNIEIESSETGELINVESDVEYDLHFWSLEKTYFPGFFDIYISKGQDRKRYYFCVHPKNAELENVFDLRDYVNDFYLGMSLDLDKKRKMKVIFEDYNSSSDFARYNFMNSYYPDVINYMNRYVKSKNEQLIKKDIISHKINKVSPKSVKWLSQKGYLKNKDINNPDHLLVSKTSFTVDNEQNRVFKGYVKFWDEELNNLLHDFSKYITSIVNNITELNEQLNNLEMESRSIEQIKTISKQAKAKKVGEIKDVQAKISSLESMNDEYVKMFETIKHYKIITENIRHNTWVNSIESENKLTSARLISKELILIKEIRERYLGTRRRISYGKAQKIDYFAEKNTPKLFETYLYILLINLLEKHGFELNDYEISSDDLLFAISTESKVVLNGNNGNRCEIIYDKPLEDAQKGFVESDYCTINSQHNRPDFIVSFISKDNIITDTIVLDAKWRRFENIYNENGDTEVLTILKDYSNLAYYDANFDRVKRGVVSKVIAIYPDKEERNINIYSGLISYVGINICKEIETTKNYAFLDSIIKKNIETILK